MFRRTLQILLLVLLVIFVANFAGAQDVSRFPDGVNNVEPTDIFADIEIPVAVNYIQFWEDFNTFTSNPKYIFSGTDTVGAVVDSTIKNWIVTQTESGASSATETILMGSLCIFTDEADNDNDFLQLKGNLFTMESGKKTWFDSKINMASECEQEDFFIGLQITDTTPLDTEGIYFAKHDGQTVWNFAVRNQVGVAAATPTFTLAEGTDYRFSFYYDGKSSIKYFVNGTHYGTAGITYMPTEPLTVSFGVQNGVADGAQVNVDYVYAARER